MAGRRFQGDHGCCRDRADGSCALAMVGRLSEERVRELAEDIWTASTRTVVQARPSPDPRSTRPGVSAEGAYRRRRKQEREAWRPGWPRRARIVTGGAGLLTGLAVGAWLGWQLALLVALLTGWRLRFRPSGGTRFWRGRRAVDVPRRSRILELSTKCALAEGFQVAAETRASWPRRVSIFPASNRPRLRTALQYFSQNLTVAATS
jgi:hypothetical protein